MGPILHLNASPSFCSSLDGIWTHTIDTLQHQSLNLMSSSLDHSTTSAPFIYVDVVEWSRALDVRLSEGAAVYQWCGFKSRWGKNKNLTALKSNSNTGLIFRCIYIYIHVLLHMHPYLIAIITSKKHVLSDTK